MLILAFDQPTARTGWALYEPPSHSSMLIGSFTSRPKTKMLTEEKTAIFCDEIEKLFRAHKPQFVVWEAAAEVVQSFAKQGREDLAGPTKAPPLTVNADQLILRDIPSKAISVTRLELGAFPMRLFSRGLGVRRSSRTEISAATKRRRRPRSSARCSAFR